MRNRIISCMLCLLLVLSVVCPATAGSTDKIVIWANADIRVFLDYFVEAYPEIPIEVIMFPYAGSDYDLTQRMDALIADTGTRPDIINVEINNARRWVDLDDVSVSLYDLGITEEELSVLTPATVDFMRDSEGRPKGISYQVTVGGLFYRRSIAQKYFGVSEPEDFQTLVKDWPTFMETAEKLDVLSRGQVRMLACAEELYYPFINGTRKQSWVADGKLVIDDAIKMLMDYTKVFYDKGYTQGFDLYSQEWYDTIHRDDTLCRLLPPWALAHWLELYCTDENGASTYGDWGLVSPPDPYIYGGTWLVCTSKDRQKYENIATILRYVMSEEGQRAYEKETGDFISNMKLQEELAATSSCDFLGGQNHYEVFRSIAASVNPTLQTGHDGFFRDCFANYAMTSYISLGYSMEEALDSFREQVGLHFNGEIDASD